MAITDPQKMLALFGLVISGDFAGLTCYKSKQGRLVSFSKTWPKKKPSLGQARARATMSMCGTTWRQMPYGWRYAWDLAAHRTHLCAHGYNFWVRYFIKQVRDQLITVQRQAKEPLASMIGTAHPEYPYRHTVYCDDLAFYPRDAMVIGSHTEMYVTPNTPCHVQICPIRYGWPNWDPLENYYDLSPPGEGLVLCDDLYNHGWAAVRYTPPNYQHDVRMRIWAKWPDGMARHHTCWFHIRYPY